MIKLNEQKFLDELNSKWQTKECPMCGKNNWNIDTNIVTALRVNETGGISLGGKVMPLIAITCMNCGNVLFINPLTINALNNDSKEASKNE